jgi:hypothetical protein
MELDKSAVQPSDGRELVMANRKPIPARLFARRKPSPAVSEDDMRMSAVNLSCLVFHFLSSFGY